MKSLTVVGPRAIPPQDPRSWKAPKPRRPAMAGPGRLRKIAFLGGAYSTLRHAPWSDLSWELWAHASCRHQCQREPDLLFDLHPPELWRDPKRKTWDPTYRDWLKQNHIPMMMQDHYPDVPASIRYPFETMITEFPRGYMTNSIAYMFALALMEGVTHIALYGCHYSSKSEYGPQRGCAEYWCGVAEGRGVQVLIPPTCDLLNRPHLLYGYQSHPDGVRDPAYSFEMAIPKSMEKKPDLPTGGPDPTPLKAGGDQIPLMTLPEPAAVERANFQSVADILRYHLAQHPKESVSGVHVPE